MNILAMINAVRKGQMEADEICEFLSQAIGGEVEMTPLHETSRAELESIFLPCLAGTSATMITGTSKSGMGIKMVFILEPKAAESKISS